MSKALRTRIRRNLVSLIMTGSTDSIARLATGDQGIGIAGLGSSSPKTAFKAVFTGHPDHLQSHERQAGVSLILLSTPSLFLSDDLDGTKRVREFEKLAGLPKEHCWTTRLGDGERDGDDDVWLADWLSCLMDDLDSVDRLVRLALIEVVDEPMLDDIEDSINREIDEIIERRYAEH